MNGDGKLLLPREASALLNVHTRTVARWAEQGKFAFIMTPGGRRRYPERPLRAYIALYTRRPR